MKRRLVAYIGAAVLAVSTAGIAHAAEPAGAPSRPGSTTTGITQQAPAGVHGAGTQGSCWGYCGT
jgi:hypothetical protein